MKFADLLKAFNKSTKVTKKVRKIGGTEVTFYTKGPVADIQQKMNNLGVWHKAGSRTMKGLKKEAGGASTHQLLRALNSYMRQNGTISFGTANRTIKGGRIRIDVQSLKKSKSIGKPSLREIYHHEKFHTIPFIGKSESFAHAYGGARAKKGKVSLSGAARGYRHLWSTFPTRAKSELKTGAKYAAGTTLIAGGGAYAATKQKEKVVYRRIRGRIVPIKVKA